MKKTIILWLAPFIVFFGAFLSSQLKSPHRASPQSAMQHLIASMKHKDIDGISEVSTNQGKSQLMGIEKNSESKNIGLYDYVESKGFRFNSQQHGSLDIWSIWANHVDTNKVRMVKDHEYKNGIQCDFRNDTAVFIFTKSTWSGWKLDSVIYVVVR